MTTLNTLFGPGEGHPHEMSAEQRIEHLLALNKAAIAITSELELDALLQQIVDSVRELVGSKYAALGVLGDDGYLERFPTSGISEVDREKIGAPPRGHGLLGVMLHAGRSLRIPDMSQDSRRVGFPPHHPPMTSLLGVPIFVRDKLVGDLYLTDKIGGPEFSEEDEWIVQLLATHAATALINAELHSANLQAIERLRELEKMKDEFLSTAAHELRTPLTTIRMSAGLAYDQLQMRVENQELASGDGEPDMDPRLLTPDSYVDRRLLELLGLIVEGATRMQSLVNDLLDLTRLEQGRTQLNMEDLDLREVIRASVESTKPLFDNKEQQITMHLPETYCGVMADRERLEQVVINLLSNAHKYSPAGMPIEVRVKRSGDKCIVTVRDSGPGVPEDERELIFERFYRSSLHRSDRTASTGLGLPIARKIAEMHKGKLWVEPAPGEG